MIGAIGYSSSIQLETESSVKAQLLGKILGSNFFQPNAQLANQTYLNFSQRWRWEKKKLMCQHRHQLEQNNYHLHLMSQVTHSILTTIVSKWWYCYFYPWLSFCNPVDQCDAHSDCSKNFYEKWCCWGHCRRSPWLCWWNPNPAVKCSDDSDCAWNTHNEHCCDGLCSPNDCPPDPIVGCSKDEHCEENENNKYCCDFECGPKKCDRNPYEECCEDEVCLLN